MPSASNANEPANRPRRGSYLYDTTGRRYLDGSAGAAAFSVGHDNPEVNAAIAVSSRRSGTTWAVAPLADSRAQLFGVSSRASWCRQPQTIAETRVPTVRRPSPRRRVAQPGLSRRIGAGQTMGDAILSRDR